MSFIDMPSMDEFVPKSPEHDSKLLSATRVVSGSGKMLVTVVGPSSHAGYLKYLESIASVLSEEQRKVYEDLRLPSPFYDGRFDAYFKELEIAKESTSTVQKNAKPLESQEEDIYMQEADAKPQEAIRKSARKITTHLSNLIEAMETALNGLRREQELVEAALNEGN
ncbi:hypothetical protein M3Y98_00803300 [Aphelenchoides besseyi]|nr:hypothetical protein M3Y98_00803300 [Aphelenchoides besseyi]